MTDAEFRTQYNRLREAHKLYFESQERFKTTWEYVKDLDVDWFKSLVDRIVIATNLRTDDRRYDIAEAAAYERRNRKSVELAEDTAKALEAMKSQMSDEGFKKSLKKFNADSLWEAVQNARKARV